MSHGLRRRSNRSGLVSSLGGLGTALLPEESAEVVEGGRVGDAGEDDFGSVVVDDGLGKGAVAGLELGEVLPDGDELDADSSGGGGELGEVGQGGNVGCLVNHEEQGFRKSCFGPVGSAVDGVDSFFDEGGE